MIDPHTGYSQNALWDAIPPHMRPGLTAYLTWGQPVGSFLTAALSGDLINAYRNADEDNKSALGAYAFFLINYADPRAYGSPEKVREWIVAGGAQGLLQKSGGA